MRFEFGERRFDRIEVGAIGWQVAKFDAFGPKQGCYSLDLVRGQIIQNQRIASLQAGNQYWLEIHPEDLGIQRPIHQKRGSDLIVAQSC